MRTLSALLLLGSLAVAFAAASAPTSCTTCHGNPDWFADEGQRQTAESFSADVHARAGLSCHDCHGGNPDMALAEDPAGAMDPDLGENPYRGKPDRADVPAFCGGCHSDPSYMKGFDPGARVDQELEYRTSQHGLGLARGDPNVATCVSCHSAHQILPIGDPGSPVHPTHVAATCASCHADAERMAGYALPDGRPLPVDQPAAWQESVHARALARGDLSAPTCNDCHGNHGARPPGLDTLESVCGHCHAREAALFRESPKQRGFAEHNEVYLAAGLGCESCHELPLAEAQGEFAHGFSACATCHGNHRVLRPTIALLAPLPATPCAFCHEGQGLPATGEEEPEQIRLRYEEARDRLLSETAGLEGDALFDSMVDRMLALPPHHRGDASSQRTGADLLPVFTRLFDRFRLGKTGHDPSGLLGTGVKTSGVRCNACHPSSTADGGAGYAAGREMVERMRELTVLTARADRSLLAARRGGVAIQEAALEHLDKAVDAQIELEVLLHGFRSDASSPFGEKQREGLEHARAALTGGRAALRELGSRRRGLAAALAVIGMVLVGVALKIRRLPT